MLFNSWSYLVFFPVVFLIYAIIPSNIRHIWLLLSSCFFYMSWEWKFGFLMLYVTVVTYVSGNIIHKLRFETDMIRKTAMGGCIFLTAIPLIVYKYLDFILGNANYLLEIAGVNQIKQFNLILPVGISFFTFQALGYVIDVYRGNVSPQRSFVKYALFVAFFPQLVAGPIERTPNLLKQIDGIVDIKPWNYVRITNGLIYMLYGFFIKLVVADRLGILVDYVYADITGYGFVELAIAAAAFSLQIYCDFSSYSIIAIGTAQVFGFSLMENFHAPYFSHSIKEFWRNWHISLSTWFRDYVYIPMGGNRKGKLRKNFNIMIVFLLSGIWHGAGWNFIVWGGIHGLLQVIGEVLSPIREKLRIIFGTPKEAVLYRYWKVISVFSMTSIAWIFFRSSSLSGALKYIIRMFTNINPWALWDGSVYRIGLSQYEVNISVAGLMVIFFADLILKKKNLRLDSFLDSQGAIAKGFIIITLMLFIGIYGKYGGYDAQQFIYFQF